MRDKIINRSQYMAGKIYILYDGRACGNAGTDEAIVFVSCDSNHEAEKYKGEFGNMACYSYDISETEGTKKRAALINEKWEWDYKV